MANAKIVQSEPVIRPPAEVVLTLSMEEAESLRLIVGCVSGSFLGPRGHIQEIFNALEEAGVNWDYNKAPRGSLRFD